MALDFSGRTVVVAGPAGSFADAVAEQFAAQGANVTQHHDGAAAAKWMETHDADPAALILTIDATDDGRLADLDATAVEQLCAHRIAGAIAAINVALARMRQVGYGRIVACVPPGATFGAERGIASAIAGAAMTALIKSVAQSNRCFDLRANCLSYVTATAASEALFEEHPVLDPALFEVQSVLPAITYLAHRSCELTGEVLSAAAGRFAKLYTASTLGVLAPAQCDDAFGETIPKLADTRFTFSPRTTIDELITINV